MKTIGEEYQSADWKKEKHVPVIDCGDRVKEGENLQVTITVGKEVAHPNTTEHHIRWIQLYFKPEGPIKNILLKTTIFQHEFGLLNQSFDCSVLIAAQIWYLRSCLNTE